MGRGEGGRVGVGRVGVRRGRRVGARVVEGMVAKSGIVVVEAVVAKTGGVVAKTG